MGVLSDRQIELEKIVTPFLNAQRKAGVITYGVSSYGYDLRASSTFKVFSSVKGAGGIIDPKNFEQKMLETVEGKAIIPPNGFALTHSMERLEVPRDILCIVLGKSTYARCGIIVNCTPLEPEWKGHVTIEISNTTSLPAVIYGGEGIAQVLFLRADAYCQVLFKDFIVRTAEELAKNASPAVRAKAEQAEDPAAYWKQLATEHATKLALSQACQESYADKDGRYQNQGDQVVTPCVRSE